jgi:hypothetical protein
MRIAPAIALVPVTLAGLLYCTEIACADAFSFPSAEFMRGDDGVRAARAFIKDQLPSGLPISVAIARVEKADASCHISTVGDTVVTCEYFILARPVGGDLGENIWTVKLFPGPDATLADASLSRTRVGMPGYPTMSAY